MKLPLARVVATSLVLASSAACTGSPTPHAQSPALACAPLEAAPTIEPLLAVLGPAAPQSIQNAQVVSVELDGAPPAEVVLTAIGTVPDDTPGGTPGFFVSQTGLWVFRRVGEGFALLTSETSTLEDPGTFEASPGQTVVHVMNVDGCRQAVFVRTETAQGGHDPRSLLVEVAAMTLEGQRFVRAWRCETTAMIVDGAERDVTQDDERTLEFDDETRSIAVAETSPSVAQTTYRYAGARWIAQGPDLCRSDP